MWWDRSDKALRAPTETKPFPFMRLRWIGFIVTAVIFGASTVSLVTRGLNLGLDFTGGVLIEATKPTAFDDATLRQGLEKSGFNDAMVQLADGGKSAFIRLHIENGGADVENVTRKVNTVLGSQATIRKTDAVGPRVSDELLRGGVLACLLSVVMIAVYVWFRFESKFGWAAFVTTFHDVFAIVGLFSITRWTFDLTIVAAVLTIAGYSINDTVVVFDRIREMLKKYKRLPFQQIVDISITSTLSRTVVTSVATLIAVLAMLFLGGPVLFGFAASIAFGILVGTYSSIFVAAPMLVYLPGRLPGQRPDGEAAAPAGA